MAKKNTAAVNTWYPARCHDVTRPERKPVCCNDCNSATAESDQNGIKLLSCGT